MLPGLQRLRRPLVMQSVGRSDVHEVNFGVFQELVVGPVGFGEVVFFFGLLGCGEVARGDGVEDYPGVRLSRVDYFIFISTGGICWCSYDGCLLPAALICAVEITPTFSASGLLLGVGWRRD